MLYHGSNNPNLSAEISAEGVGTGTGCSGFFCCARACQARYYGSFVYRTEEPTSFFDNRDVDADVLADVLAEHGIDYAEHRDLCWAAVAAEDLRSYEREEWADLVDRDEDDALWFAQALRIELARRQGFQAVGMNDECGSIVILREFASFEPVEICPECGEDRHGEDCDCDE